MKTPKSIPPHNAVRFKAGELIYREGPKTRAELLAAFSFGNAFTPQRRTWTVRLKAAGLWLPMV